MVNQGWVGEQRDKPSGKSGQEENQDSGASGGEPRREPSEVPSRVPRGEPSIKNQEPSHIQQNQGKEPSVGQVVNQDTKSCEPRPKVKNQAWTKWRTKIKLVSQVKNQVVNQAKTND